MTRTIMGSKFGQMGFYVSQPGDDLDNPQKNLLLDTRFSALEIHFSGRASLNRTGPINGTYTYRRTISYPTLGYIPITYIGLIDNDSDVVTYPPNINTVNGRVTNNAYARIRVNEIEVFYEIGGGNNAFNASFSYVIFRNPA